VTPRRILAAGWLVFLLYAYPGFLQTDGVDQLVDSRVGEFTDWHSPMMTQLWRIVGVVISGPAGMLFVQSLLLLGGTYQLLRRAMADRAAAIAAVCVLGFPPLVATTALISPEAQLASFLLAGAAALASERLAIRIGGLGLMVVACGMRDGASLAALPIIVAGFRWRDEPRWHRLAIATLAWVVVVVAAVGLERLFVDTRTERNEVSLAISDIVGTLHFANELDDGELQALLADTPLASSTGIQQRARTLYGKSALYTTTDQRLFDPPWSAAQREGLIEARGALARAAPAGYLTHRGARFVRLLGLPRSRPWSPLHTQFVGDPAQATAIQHSARHSVLQATLIRPVEWLSQTFLFRPYVYFILALVLLPVAAVRRQRESTLLFASAVGYELALMFVSARGDYRESHWMIAATVLAIILLIARGATRPATRP